MKSGEVLMVPRFIADHAVKHLVNQILNRMKKPTSYPLREEIAGKIVLGIQKMDMPEQFSKEQIAIKKSDELNRGSDLDKILARHKEKEPLETGNKAFVTPSGNVLVPPEVPPPPPPDSTNEEKEDESFEGLGPVVDTTDSEVKEEPKAEVEPPTRQQLYNHASKVQGMDLNDDKTMKKLENLSIKELITELQFEQ
jgi:hypothetical protein